MNGIVAAYPAGTGIHVVLDNLSTHKPRNDRWIHPNVHFHFTPTRVLAQPSGDLVLHPAGTVLRAASFDSIKQLRNAFIEAYNQDASPFVWIKQEVHQHCFKGRRIRNYDSGC